MIGRRTGKLSCCGRGDVWAERGVRFIQFYHRDWNHHGKLPKGMPKMCQQTDQSAAALVRDNHPRCFTVWMACGGMKPGLTYGATDDFSYNSTGNPVPVHDLQATILHCLGIDHKQLTYKFQGRHYRLTDVSGEVVQDLLS